MNRLDTKSRAQIVRLLVEGMNINSIVRTTGISKPTILKLLCDLGAACSTYQYENVVNLSCKFVQADEIWSFVYVKDKNVPADRKGEPGIGDVWTWSAVDADSKLILSWRVGTRGAVDAKAFMLDIASRVNGRFQLSTDGHGAYLNAVIDAFGTDGVDYAMIVKKHGSDPYAERRYSPSVCIGIEKSERLSQPDMDAVSTSLVEQTNLTLRMGNRRFTRLTNAHSKKIENHEASIALHLMYYNFARPHEALTRRSNGRKTTPAMAAGLETRGWSIEDIVGLLNH